MQVFQVKFVSDTNYCSTKFKIICNSIVIFIFEHFWGSVVKDNENWLLVLKNCARRGFLVLGSNGSTILGPREENSWTTMTYSVSHLTWNAP
jgi:hypothetical protein